METRSRYEIVDTIAVGDFGTVYRGRDRELGREVAIKQIHQQFLHDERQLARYWQEAQLLASLQHPHILTIYDIVRSRGWLIVELMRGSLKQATQGEPIDLDFLRVALACALSALHFLHGNGIIHGDVKPSNLLVDAQNRVKLGDFGLARRAANEEGSLLKGTTKYMAPELVSTQFGPVGPASDLYSLGFSAFELMCGNQFEALFPSLATFGRDKQIAWMMWHAAADRQLPEIGRVLEGVPEDLQHVIQRLVVKDQARRYQSALDVLRDLRPGAMTAIPEEKPPEPAPDANAKRRRMLVIGAAAFACLISALMVFMPSAGRRGTRALGPPPPLRGTIRNVYVDEWKLVLESAEDGRPREIAVKPKDRIFINGKSTLLRDLQPNDQASIKNVPDDYGFPIQEIQATRPELNRGIIAAVKPDEGQFTLKIGEGEEQGKKIVIALPATVKVLLNGQDQIDHHPVRLADLKADDRVSVRHAGSETGRVATELSVERDVEVAGVLRNIDTAKQEMTFAVGDEASPELLVLPYTSKCKVTVNGLTVIEQQLLKPSDLRPGDKATVLHNLQIVQVDAHRVLGDVGTIQKAEYSLRVLEVLRSGNATPVTYLVPKTCRIALEGQAAELEDLRVGDLVDIAHDTPDARSPEAKTISAQRPPQPNRWAILIANQDYEDVTLSPLKYPVADAKLLEEVLVHRYGVPVDQVLLLADESQVRLEQGIPALLARTKAESSLIVYYAGHGYVDEENKVYLAPKNFAFKRMSTTGLTLGWLVDLLEQCPAHEKLLLLDCSHEAGGEDLKAEPSTEEMLRTLAASPGRSPLKTGTAITSCKVGQRGLDLPAKEHGLFAWCLADGFSGRADKNRDNRLEPTELYDYLLSGMAAAAGELKKVQSPVLILPDARAPRLTEEAKVAIRKQAAMMRQEHIDWKAAQAAYLAAQELAGKEPEPKLLAGLVLLKIKRRKEADNTFEPLNAANPDQIVPPLTLAWIHFEQQGYQVGVETFAEAVARIPAVKDPNGVHPEVIQHTFRWIGQLREFAATAALASPQAIRAPEDSLKKLDAAVASRGGDAQRLYEEGRAKTQEVLEAFDQRISDAKSDEAQTAMLRIHRRQLPNYAQFPYDDMVQQVLAGLDN